MATPVNTDLLVTWTKVGNRRFPAMTNLGPVSELLAQPDLTTAVGNVLPPPEVLAEDFLKLKRIVYELVQWMAQTFDDLPLSLVEDTAEGED